MADTPQAELDTGLMEALAVKNLPPRSNPDWDAIAAFVAPDDSIRTPEENQALGQGMARSYTEQYVGSILDSEGTPEEKLVRIQRLAATYNDPSILRAQAFLEQRLREQPAAQDVEETEAQIRARRAANAAVSRRMLQGYLDKLKRERGGTAFDLPGFAREMIAPTFSVTLGNILSDVDPEFTWADYATPADRMAAFRKSVFDAASPELARKRVAAFLQAADATRQEWYTTDYTVGDAVASVLADIDEADPKTWDAIVPAFEALAVVPFVGALWRGGKRLVGLRKGSVADSASQTETGAATLVAAAAKGEDAKLAAMGTDPAAVAGDMILPKTGLDSPDTGIPFLANNWLPPEARTEAMNAVRERAKTAFGERVNALNINLIDGGMEYVARVGTLNGELFKSRQAAERFLKSAPTFERAGGRVVETGVLPKPGRTISDAELGHIISSAVRADATLPPEAARAIDDFVGHPAGHPSSQTGLGIFDARRIEDAFSSRPSVEGQRIAEQLEVRFAPVRQRLLEAVGPTITLYRAQRRADEIAGKAGRNVLSWTASKEVAESFARAPVPKPATVEQIDAAVETYNRTGFVKFRGYKFIKNTRSPQFFNIYHGKEFITDGDDLRALLVKDRDDLLERAAEAARVGRPIETRDVSIQDIVWITNRANQREFLVRESGRPRQSYVIEYSGKTPWDLSHLDTTTFKDATKNGIWAWLLGKGVAFGDHLVQSSTVAELRRSNIEAAVKKAAEPFYRLPGLSKDKAYAVLKQYEGRDVKVDAAALRSHGLNEDEVAGALAWRRVADFQWSVKNENTRAGLMAAGYRHIAGKSDYVGKAVDSLPTTARVVNMHSGRAARKGAYDSKNYTFYELFEETADGFTHGVLPKQASTLVNDLPLQVLAYVPNHLTRIYRAPIFVREVLADGRTVAMHTAQDPRSAQQFKERFEAANPGRKVGIYPAKEIAGDPTSTFEVQQLREAGLLWNSHRRVHALTDVVTGEADLLGPVAALDATIRSAAYNATTARYVAAMAKMWDNTYGHIKELGKFNVARRPGRLAEASQQKEIEEALALHRFIQAQAGVHPDMWTGPVRSWLNSVAGAVYGAAAGVEKLTGGRTTAGLRTLGNNLTGLTHGISDSLKTAAVVNYMFLNPIRSGWMQMTMIPLYFSVRGGARYMASGSFHRDMAVLTAMRSFPKQAQAIGRKAGMKDAEIAELWDSFERSGLLQTVDNHIFTIGAAVDSKFAQAGVVGEKFAQLVNIGKRNGFDVGVKNDYSAAWLIARNRFRVDNGRLPKTADEWEKVASDAAGFALNQNRSDVLLTQHGLLSLFTQFLSFNIKMSGRLLTALPGVKTESYLSKAEVRRMAALSFLTYGTAGYGINEVVQAFENKHGPIENEEAKHLLREGLLGYAFSATMGLIDADDDPVRIAYSGTFSPTNFVGNGFKYLAALFESIAEMDTAALDAMPDPISSPGLSLVSDVRELVSFAYKLGGRVDMPATDVAVATAREFFRKVPAVSNTARALMGLHLGVGVDSRGTRTAEIAKGSAIAAIMGLRDYKEVEASTLVREYYSRMQTTDPDQLAGDLKRDAEAMADVVKRAWRGMLTGTEVTVADVDKLITEHAISMRTALPPAYHSLYFQAFRRALLDAEMSKADKLEPLIRGVVNRGASGVVLDESFVNRIKSLQDFPNKEPLVRWLETTLAVVEHKELPEEAD